jgi:hypothetical protein
MHELIRFLLLGLAFSVVPVSSASEVQVEVATDEGVPADRLAKAEAVCRQLAEDAAAAKRVVPEPTKPVADRQREGPRGLFGGLSRSVSEPAIRTPAERAVGDEVPADLEAAAEQAYKVAYRACMEAQGYPEVKE